MEEVPALLLISIVVRHASSAVFLACDYLLPLEVVNGTRPFGLVGVIFSGALVKRLTSVVFVPFSHLLL